MSIFTTFGQKHLYRIAETKKLTMGKEILSFEPKEVFVPVVDPVTSKPVDLKVAVGDEVKEGQLIGTRPENGLPVFASVSGKIVREETLFHANLGRNVKHFVIENDLKHVKVEPLKELGDDATSEEIVARMKEVGLSGHGGAGFPTFIKYQGATTKNIDTILINAVECEPFLTTDHEAMLKNKEEILKGISFMIKAAGAEKAYIVYKKGNPDLDEAYADLSSYPNIEVRKVKNVYPAGWERYIVKATLKRTYNRLPAEANVIVNNVTTCLMLAKAMKGEVETRKVITVSGNGVQNPNNVELPIYTRAIDVIEFLGGYVGESVSVSFGGPMCSRGVMDDKAVLLPFNNALTILPRIKLDTLPCLRCGACTEHCPSGLQPVEIKQAYQAKNMDRMLALTPWHCIACGLCSYVCPSKIDVNDFVKKAKLMTSVQLKKMEAQKSKEGK